MEKESESSWKKKHGEMFGGEIGAAPEILGRKARVVFAPLRGKAHMLISPTAPDQTAGSAIKRSPPEKEAFVRRGVSRDTGCLHCGLSQARKIEVGLKDHYIFA